MSFSLNACVTNLIRVHDGLVRLQVRLHVGSLDHEAGQYTTLGLDGKRCPYSISSPILREDGQGLIAADDPLLEFYVRTDESEFGAALGALQPGNPIEVGPEAGGSCTLDQVPLSADVLLCSTGTGEAPHNALITELLRRGQTGRVAAVVSCREKRDMAYRRIHQRLAMDHPGYTYLAFATREGAYAGRHLQDLLQDGTLARETGVRLEPGAVHIFLCGNAAMVGRPTLEEGTWQFPPGPGLTELLATGFGLRPDGPDSPGEIHFERYD
jgi:ferredoxin--NADP+ reductase